LNACGTPDLFSETELCMVVLMGITRVVGCTVPCAATAEVSDAVWDDDDG
jgi:hypothetical protein